MESFSISQNGGLLSDSVCQQFCINSFKGGGQVSGIGGLFSLTQISSTISDELLISEKGSCEVKSSHSTIPNEYTSADSLYFNPNNTSGAIQSFKKKKIR